MTTNSKPPRYPTLPIGELPSLRTKSYPLYVFGAEYTFEEIHERFPPEIDKIRRDGLVSYSKAKETWFGGWSQAGLHKKHRINSIHKGHNADAIIIICSTNRSQEFIDLSTDEAFLKEARKVLELGPEKEFKWYRLS